MPTTKCAWLCSFLVRFSTNFLRNHTAKWKNVKHEMKISGSASMQIHFLTYVKFLRLHSGAIRSRLMLKTPRYVMSRFSAGGHLISLGMTSSESTWK